MEGVEPDTDVGLDRRDGSRGLVVGLKAVPRVHKGNRGLNEAVEALSPGLQHVTVKEGLSTGASRPYLDLLCCLDEDAGAAERRSLSLALIGQSDATTWTTQPGTGTRSMRGHIQAMASDAPGVKRARSRRACIVIRVQAEGVSSGVTPLPSRMTGDVNIAAEKNKIQGYMQENMPFLPKTADFGLPKPIQSTSPSAHAEVYLQPHRA